jgi:hypothetical protein
MITTRSQWTTRAAVSVVTKLLLLMVVMLVAPVVHAGAVETVGGKFEGQVSFQANAVKVGDKEVAFEDILYLHADAAANSPTATKQPATQRVRLKNGEVWIGEIVSASSKQVEVQSGWFGKKGIALDQVSVLDFMPSEPISSATKANTLYRKLGPPVPGSIVWIDKGTLGLDSPLGTITIQRKGLIRYFLNDKPVKSTDALDEIGLVDGNVFRGRLEMKANEVILTHPVAGRATIPSKAVSYIVRHRAQMFELADLPHEVIKTDDAGLSKGRQLRIAGSASTNKSGAGFIRATRLEPKVKIRYSLPERDGNKLLFRATLAPIESAHGDAHIKISVGQQTVLEQTLSSTDSPKPINVEIPAGKELVIDVDFGPLLRFPCGVLLQDAHLILVK